MSARKEKTSGAWITSVSGGSGTKSVDEILKDVGFLEEKIPHAHSKINCEFQQRDSMPVSPYLNLQSIVLALAASDRVSDARNKATSWARELYSHGAFTASSAPQTPSELVLRIEESLGIERSSPART